MPTLKNTTFRLLAMAVSIISIFVLLELSAYFIIVIRNKNFYLPLELKKAADPEVISEFAEVYCRACGWHPQYKSHEFHYRGDIKAHDRAIMALFGDSFTQGYKEIEKSWPFLLEQKLQKPVLNFGVGGHGADQALWRFEQHYAKTFNAPYVVLAIMPGDIARNVNIYRGFFNRRTRINTTKPRYYIDSNDRITLLPNPLKSPEDLANLADTGFLKEIGRNDYWYQHYEKYNLNQLVQFPYSYYLIKALPFYVDGFIQERIGNRSEYKTLYTDSAAVRIQHFVIEKFIEKAQDIGAQPIILFLPSWTDLVDYQQTGTTVYHSFFTETQKRHEHCYDALEYFRQKMQAGDEVADFFISRMNGHYNPYGEQILSDGFYLDFIQLDSTF
jgi:hypothetical protein